MTRPFFSSICEDMISRHGLIYVSQSTVYDLAYKLGVTKDELTAYEVAYPVLPVRQARYELAEKIVQKKFNTPHVRLYSDKMGSCIDMFQPYWYVSKIFIQLDEDFLKDRLAVNKFKLTHPEQCATIVVAYNHVIEWDKATKRVDDHLYEPRSHDYARTCFRQYHRYDR